MAYDKIVAADDASYQLPPLVRDRIVANIVDDSATVKTNLVTNPSFETGTAGWVARGPGGGGVSISRVTSPVYSGSGSLKIIKSSASTQADWGATVSPDINVSAGTSYAFSAYYRSDSSNLDVNIHVIWRDSADNWISTSDSGTINVTSTAWTRVSFSATAPVNSVKATIVFSSPALSSTFYIDNVQIEVGSSASDYFDGSLPIEDGAIYAWTGKPHASTSTKTITTDERSAVAEVAREESAYLIQQSYESGVLSPNYIINGALDIWQRGTNFPAGAASGYRADRWFANSSTGQSVTRSTDIPNIPVQYSLITTSTTSVLNTILYRMEVADSSKLGDVLTLSVYAKNISGSTGLRVAIDVPLAVENFSSISSDPILVLAGPGSFSSSWQRYSVTFNLPAGARERGFGFQFQRTSAGATSYAIAGVQLEEGSVATSFRRNANSIQGELAACQRYYYRMNDPSLGGPSATNGIGWAVSTTSARTFHSFKTTMRIAPVSIEYSLLRISDASINYAISALTLDSNITSHNEARITSTSTGLTAFRPVFLCQETNAAGYLAFNAEL